MTRLKLVAVLAAVAALGGCAAHATWAAKLTPTGFPQFLDNACDSPKIEWMQIQTTGDDSVFDEKDPVIWKIEFPQPARIREVTVGQKPEGALEKVAWQQPKGDQHLSMSVKSENADTPNIQFTLDGLKDGKVHYEMEYLSSDEFAKKRVSC